MSLVAQLGDEHGGEDGGELEHGGGSPDGSFTGRYSNPCEGFVPPPSRARAPAPIQLKRFTAARDMC